MSPALISYPYLFFDTCVWLRYGEWYLKDFKNVQKFIRDKVKSGEVYTSRKVRKQFKEIRELHYTIYKEITTDYESICPELDDESSSTIGDGVDILIQKYGRIAPLKRHIEEVISSCISYGGDPLSYGNPFNEENWKKLKYRLFSGIGNIKMHLNWLYHEYFEKKNRLLNIDKEPDGISHDTFTTQCYRKLHRKLEGKLKRIQFTDFDDIHIISQIMQFCRDKELDINFVTTDSRIFDNKNTFYTTYNSIKKKNKGEFDIAWLYDFI